MFKNCSKTIISKIIKNKSDIKEPKIYFTEEVLLKFKALVSLCDKEIGWLAFVNKENGKYVIYDVILPEQEVSSVTTELTEQGLQRVSEEILLTRPDEFNNIRCWCHSHVNMACIPSGTDEETFEQFYKNCDYFIRIICNKKDEIRVDFVDLLNEIRFDNVGWSYYILNENICSFNKLQEINSKIDELEEEKKSITKEMEVVRDAKTKIIKEDLEPLVKTKVSNEKTKVTYYSDYTKKYEKDDEYNNSYGFYDDFYDDFSTFETFLCDWNELSQKEKEENCVLSYVTFKNELGIDVEPLDVLSPTEFVEVLEVETVSELKDLLKNKEFTKKYVEDDWTELFEDIEYYGISAIIEILNEELLRGVKV